jgi:murein DD-endopeptidase MepM/ murein hydrolase activator NlpD
MSRTYVVGDNPMRGQDVKDWQATVKKKFSEYFGIKCPIKLDGLYGTHSRSYSAALVKSMGMDAEWQMRDGVTPELRSKVRDKDLTAAQKRTMQSKARKAYRDKLRDQWAPKKVHPPVAKILADSWGYHPPVHDGIDVICNPNAPLYAMVRARVIDARAGGWWGKAPSGDVTKGDGIVQLEVLENVGPFKKGMHIGYGHCEHARVNVGEVVQAGEVIALAGLAVAWHIHLMVNDGSTTRGIGNRDPRPLLDYSVKHG